MKKQKLTPPPPKIKLKNPKSKPKRSEYRGVSWDRERRKWFAGIRIDGVRKFLGRYDSELDAAKAVNEAEVKYRGVKVVDLEDVKPPAPPEPAPPEPEPTPEPEPVQFRRIDIGFRMPTKLGDWCTYVDCVNKGDSKYGVHLFDVRDEAFIHNASSGNLIVSATHSWGSANNAKFTTSQHTEDGMFGLLIQRVS